MLKLYYRLFLILKGCRFIKSNRNIIVSKNIKHNNCYFWYIDNKNKFRVVLIGSENSKQSALFRYKILMNR